MTEDKPPIISSSTKKFILASALVSYVALVLFILYSVGIDELVAVIGRINVGTYAFAIGSLIISFTFHTLVWFQLLRALSLKLSFQRTYVLYWVGIFVDNLIPGGWSGDLFKAYLLNKDPTVESGKAVASVVAKNMYEAIFNLGSMIFGIILLLLNYTLEGYLLISLGGIMILLTLPLVILLGASFRPEAAKKIVAALFNCLHELGRKHWDFSEVQTKVEKALSDYHEGMNILLRRPGMLLKPMILSFFAWAFEVITLLFVFASLGQLIPLDKIIIVRSIAGNIEAQGYAFLGYAQIVTSEIYRALGVPIATGISVALLGGVMIFFIKTAISYAAFHRTIFAAHDSKQTKKS